MIDRETAFRYLSGALTGGPRPDAVGRKFDAEGRVLRFPGNTTLCHIDRDSDAFAALAEAQRLVTDTAMSLTDIGLATGFASQSSFSRAFRAAYGRSAREVRSGR